MTRTEMNCRIAAMTPDQLARVYRMVRDGYRTASIMAATMATTKQINAVAEWVHRYGAIVPTVAGCARAA